MNLANTSLLVDDVATAPSGQVISRDIDIVFIFMIVVFNDEYLLFYWSYQTIANHRCKLPHYVHTNCRYILKTKSLKCFSHGWSQKCRVCPSQKGFPQILLDRFFYTHNRTRKESVHWGCVTKTCTGKCTILSAIVSDIPQTATIFQVRFISTPRKRSREVAAPMQQIYNNDVGKQTSKSGPHLLSFPSISSTLYRQRQVSRTE